MFPYFLPSDISDSTKMSEEELSLQQVALYASVSFMVVSLLGVFLYITCSRRYRLNWFENNLLETAQESRELNDR